MSINLKYKKEYLEILKFKDLKYTEGGENYFFIDRENAFFGYIINKNDCLLDVTKIDQQKINLDIDNNQSYLLKETNYMITCKLKYKNNIFLCPDLDDKKIFVRTKFIEKYKHLKNITLEYENKLGYVLVKENKELRGIIVPTSIKNIPEED